MAARDDGRARSLVTVAYDGWAITTPWNHAHRFTLSAQCAQADRHREQVRTWLLLNELNRLPAVVQVGRWFVLVQPDSRPEVYVGHTIAGAAYALAYPGQRARMARHLRAYRAWRAHCQRRHARLRRMGVVR